MSEANLEVVRCLDGSVKLNFGVATFTMDAKQARKVARLLEEAAPHEVTKMDAAISVIGAIALIGLVVFVASK